MNDFLDGLDPNEYIINKFVNNDAQGLHNFQSLITELINSFLKKENLLPVYNSRIKIDTPIPINNCFVGRSKELSSLSRRLETHDTVAVFGMGGMGKTSLTAQYCNRRTKKNQFDKIVWIPYHNTLEESVLALGASYSYLNEGKQLRFGEIISYLNAIEGRKLVVIDNFDINKDEIAEKFNEIKRCFPGFKKLLTTRTDLSVLKEEINIFDLTEFNEKEAFLLFKSYYQGDIVDVKSPPPQVTPSQLSSFIEAVHGHALTIELVAKTLSNHFTMNMAKILEHLNNDTNIEPTESLPVSWHEATLAFTDISTMLYNANLLTEEERRTMELLAILCEENIDLRFLMDVIAPSENRVFEDLVNRLSTNGWIKKTGYIVNCHRIIASVVLKDAKLDIDRINKAFQKLEMMTLYNTIDNVSDKKSYFQMQRLLLSYFCNKEQLHEGIPSVLLAKNAINFYYNGSVVNTGNGNFLPPSSSDIEQKQSYRFLRYAKQICGNDVLVTCEINGCLSRILIDYDHYDEAFDLLQEALRIEDDFNKESLAKAKTLYDLAYYYHCKDLNDQAILPLTQSYELYSSLKNEYCVENLDNALLFIDIFNELEFNEETLYWANKAQYIIEHANISKSNPKFIQYYIRLSQAFKDKTLEYLDQAEALTVSLYGENHPLMGDIYFTKQRHFYNNSDYVNAEAYINKWYDNQLLNFGYSINNDFIYHYWLNQFVLDQIPDDDDGEINRYFEIYDRSVCCIHSSDPLISFEHRVNNLIQLGNAYDRDDQYEFSAKCYKEALMIYINEAYTQNDHQLRESLSHLYTLTKAKKSNSEELLSKFILDSVDENEEEACETVEDPKEYTEELQRKLSKKQVFINLLSGVIVSYIEAEDYESAKAELEDPIILGFFKDDLFSMKKITCLKGQVSLYLGEYETAEDYFRSCLQVENNKQLQNLRRSVAIAYNNYLVDVENKTTEPNIDIFISLLNKAIELTQDDNVYAFTYLHTYLAHCYLDKKTPDGAIMAKEIVRKLITIEEQKNQGNRLSVDLRFLYTLLGTCCLFLDNTNEALEWMIKATKDGEFSEFWDQNFNDLLAKTAGHREANDVDTIKDDFLEMLRYYESLGENFFDIVNRLPRSQMFAVIDIGLHYLTETNAKNLEEIEELYEKQLSLLKNPIEHPDCSEELRQVYLKAIISYRKILNKLGKTSAAEELLQQERTITEKWYRKASKDDYSY